MKKLTIIIISILILSGCSSLKITSYWKAKNTEPANYKKILVFGLIKETDKSLVSEMEQHFVGDLKALGYNAVSAYEEFGPKACEGVEEAKAIERLSNEHIDAVITIVLLNKEKESNYIPQKMQNSPYSSYQNHFWSYRTTLHNRIFEPGYYVTSTKYFWESNLFDMRDQKLLYSVQTKSFDPADTESMAHEYGQLIVKSMVKENVLKSNPSMLSLH